MCGQTPLSFAYCPVLLSFLALPEFVLHFVLRTRESQIKCVTFAKGKIKTEPPHILSNFFSLFWVCCFSCDSHVQNVPLSHAREHVVTIIKRKINRNKNRTTVVSLLLFLRCKYELPFTQSVKTHAWRPQNPPWKKKEQNLSARPALVSFIVIYTDKILFPRLLFQHLAVGFFTLLTE